MIVVIDKSLVKDTQKITSQKLLHTLASCIEEMQEAHSISSIKHCKKMKGSSTAYRVRLGDYRLGFYFENQTIIVVRFLHRSKIYDVFPS